MFQPLSRRRFLQVSTAAIAGSSLALAAEEKGFTPLFNGQNLDGWEGDSLLWVVEDGMLVGRSPQIPYNDFLATRESFSNFILKVQVQLVDNAGNSGVQFRSQRIPGAMEMIGYQADIGQGYWGSLYDESRRKKNLIETDAKVLAKALKPTGWNEYEIHAEGPHIVLKINGVTTADYTETDTSIDQNGRIAVQLHSGPAFEVRFKDILLKQL